MDRVTRPRETRPVWSPTKWWRVVMMDGTVWAESSNEQEVRESATGCPGGGILQRLYERSHSEWRAEP